MQEPTKKTNTQLLREIQDVVDDLNNKKSQVETLLVAIDALEHKYYDLLEETKKNNKNNG